VGISGGASARGRNFILKVDTATLPAGSTFTTENPRVRRITPGIPVRFDFGVKIADGRIGGGSAKAMVELGEVFFESGRATIDARYEDLFQKILEPIKSAKGGRLLITAHADAEDLALRRAQAVRTALNEKLDAATAAQTLIELRTEIDGSAALVTLDSNVVLGELLFDTDRAAIRPQYQKLIEQIAQNINQRGTGTIEIAGHADARASAEHNLALSQRRADAVFRAIAALISEQARQRLRVVVSATPTPPAMSAGARK
jgi:outer membrane protein OmpA-like peptidoglycan-associated protein